MVPKKIIDYANTKEAFSLEYHSQYDCYKTVPVPNNLDKYYRNPNYISHTDANDTWIAKAYQLVKKIAIKNKAQLISNLSKTEQKSILDIGCGTGSFLEYVNSRGWQSYGVEPNELAREKAIHKGVTCYAATKAISDNKFKVITLWHVLEHVEDLSFQFEEIQRLLEKDGVLIIAVPNYKSFDAKYYKEFWAAYDVPRHIWHFSENSIKCLANNFGFKLEATKPMWFDAFYVSMLSEKYKNQNNYLKALLIGCLSNLKAIFSKEYSSKIYILRK